MSPVGVWRASVADERSRDIFFVALARALGIPAWIDEVKGRFNIRILLTAVEKWQDIRWDFEATEQLWASSAIVRANYRPIRSLDNPKYYSHFTLSRFEEGTFRLLNYDEGTTSWEQLLKNGTRLDTGYYMLTTGTRLANGGVLANLSFFNVEKDHNATVDLVMRESETQVQVIGSFDSGHFFVR